MLCLCYTCSKPVTVSTLAVKIPSGKLSRLFGNYPAQRVSQTPRQQRSVHICVLYTYIFINYLCMYRRVYKWTLPRCNFFILSSPIPFLFFRRYIGHFRLHSNMAGLRTDPNPDASCPNLRTRWTFLWRTPHGHTQTTQAQAK